MRRLLCSMALAALIFALPAYAVKTAKVHRHATTTKVARAHHAHSRAAVVAVTQKKSRHSRVVQRPVKVHALPVRKAHLQRVTLERIVVPAPMRGSHESLLRQNTIADQEGLARIEDNNDLAQMVQRKELVSLPTGVLVNPEMPQNRRYCRRWTAKFLADLAVAHQLKFNHPLEVTSAVRTVETQKALLRVNGNAAPAQGEVASPHLTGAAVDIAKKGMSINEIAWMRAWLMPLQTAGKIDVEEEFVQSCFHISVYEKYMTGAVHDTNSLALTSARVPAPTQKAVAAKVVPVRLSRVRRHHRGYGNVVARRNVGSSQRRMG